MLSDHSQLISNRSFVCRQIYDRNNPMPQQDRNCLFIRLSFIRWFFGVGTVGDVAPQVQNLLVQEAWNPMMVMMQLWGRLAGYQGYQGVMESLVLADPPSFQFIPKSQCIAGIAFDFTA